MAVPLTKTRSLPLAEERRRHQRVKVNLLGRYMLAARRHVDDLTGKLAPVGQHVAPEQVDLDALRAPALLGQRQRSRLGQGDGHDGSRVFGAHMPPPNDPMSLS